MSLKEAAKIGDIFVTLTGDTTVIGKEHFQAMKDSAIVANSGHFNVEIDIPALKKLSKSHRHVRNSVDEYVLRNGKRIYLLGEGRLINLASAEGHPASVMDMSFANQSLSAEYVTKNHKKLEKKVYSVPVEIDQEIARHKLKSMNIDIDELTKTQRMYMEDWKEGT